jgi:hypothetical protein
VSRISPFNKTIHWLPLSSSNPKHPYRKFPCIFTSNEAWEVKGEGLWEAVEREPALEPLPDLECEVEVVLEEEDQAFLREVAGDPAVQPFPDLGDEEVELLEAEGLVCPLAVAGEPALPLPPDHDGEEEVLEAADLACLLGVAMVLSEQGQHHC